MYIYICFYLILDGVKIKTSSRDLFLRSEISMCKMASMWESEPHKLPSRATNSSINSKISWSSTQCLDINTPFLRRESKSFSSSVHCQFLYLVYPFIPTIISRMWISLTIFVCKASAQTFEYRVRGEIFRCY